jgi:hypothetical protein
MEKQLISVCIFILVSWNVKRFNFNLRLYVGILEMEKQFSFFSVFYMMLVEYISALSFVDDTCLR